MSPAFLKTLLLTILTISVVAFPCLALDNLEPCAELNRAEDAGTFLYNTSVCTENPTTELLTICCPDEIVPGKINYNLASPQKLALGIYDQKGKEVVLLVDRAVTSGHHSLSWDGRRDDGESVKDGTYFILMKTEKSVQLRRMVLAR